MLGAAGCEGQQGVRGSRVLRAAGCYGQQGVRGSRV